MLRSLIDRLRRPATPETGSQAEMPVFARVPDGTLVCAIGDIHGRIDLLQDLEAQIVDHAESRREARRVIIYLGDYIDRGYQSREVVDHLLAPPPAGFERVCLIGNHEEFVLRFLESPTDGPVWLTNGGRETLMSYGVSLPPGMPSPDDIARAQQSLAARLPDTHLAFLRELGLYHIEGDYLFVHAGVRPGRKLDDQQPDDLLWIRGEFLDSTADHGYVVVHGHTISEEPDIRTNRIGIDTGAYASGRLTALVLSGDRRLFLRT